LAALVDAAQRLEKAMSAMTKHERDDLHRLIRQREKVLKSAAKQRSAEVLADFENQVGQEYSFDQDAVWPEATKLPMRRLPRPRNRYGHGAVK
jgi:hypothetical protein